MWTSAYQMVSSYVKCPLTTSWPSVAERSLLVLYLSQPARQALNRARIEPPWVTGESVGLESTTF
jgi:hypothetical protein